MNRSIHVRLAALAVLVSTVTSADWPAFLGGSQRQVADRTELPTTWSPTENIAWQTKLRGHGQSSPVVVGNLVYVTAVEGPMKETNWVLAFDLASGEETWAYSIESSLPVKNDVYTSRAAPTPVADENGVIAFFESGDLVALTADGKVRWQRDLMADYGRYAGQFGLGGSPTATDERVFILADNEGPSYLLAIDKVTGETIWKTDRDSRTSWSSPMIVPLAEPVGGQSEMIVVSSAGSVDGYSVSSGERLWQFNDVGGNTVASPLAAGPGQFLVGASPGRNGEESDGAKRSNLLMRIRSGDDGAMPEVVWRTTDATSSFGSPIAVGELAYYTNRAGVLYCLDLATGETVYTARLPESNWATPIATRDRIYVFGKDGRTSVWRTGREEKLIATNKLWESNGDGGPGGFAGEIQYGVAVAGGKFIVRTGDRLIAIGK